MAAAKAWKRISAAFADGSLVRVSRRKGWDDFDGSVVGMGRTWLLMATTDASAGFSGFDALRIEDVRKVVPVWNADFLQAALALEGHWPLPKLDEVDLSSTRAVVESLGQQYPLLSVHDERTRDDERFIGVPGDFRRKSFRLHEVTPRATWDHPPSRWTYREVSSISVGDRYEDRLWQIAGGPPMVKV